MEKVSKHCGVLRGQSNIMENRELIMDKINQGAEHFQRGHFKGVKALLGGQRNRMNRMEEGSGSAGSPTKARKKRVRFPGTEFDFHTFFSKKRGQKKGVKAILEPRGVRAS